MTLITGILCAILWLILFALANRTDGTDSGFSLRIIAIIMGILLCYVYISNPYGIAICIIALLVLVGMYLLAVLD